MPSNTFNEGRVVGYSAYEVYVRHSRSINPDIEPASETEWLASSLALGDSLLLKVSADSASTANTPHWRSFALPTGTNLCAANTIIGSYFTGCGDEDNLIDGMWAKSVISYGNGVVNNSAKPNGNVTTNDMKIISLNGKIPIQSANLSDDEIQGLGEYAKLLDGIILSPGTWFDSESQPPKDFTPFIAKSPTDEDYNTYKDEVPVVRLLFGGKVAHDFWLLLTGFSLSAVVQGETGLDSSVGTEHPQNGDFLGPATYPWSNKIIFSIPPAFLKYFYDSGYIRRIASTNQKEVKSHPIIDMSTTDPKTYYEDDNNADATSDSQVNLAISKLRITTEDAAILTVYQRSSIFPPALYGVRVDNPDYNSSAFTESNKLNPIDVVSPGTVKLWKEEELVGQYADSTGEWISDFEQKTPHNRALVKDSASILHQRNSSGTDVPVADTYVNSISGVLVNVAATSPYFHYQTNAGDPQYYAGFGALMNRRITGNLSDAFKADCGLEYGSPELDEVINKFTNNYYVLTSQPADWTTNWTSYYRKVGDTYVQLTDETAPPFATNTFYRLSRYSVNISMYSDLIRPDLEKLSSEPTDWSTNWSNYFYSNGRKVIGDAAPSFADDTYYKKVGNNIDNFYFVLQCGVTNSTNAINVWYLVPVREGTNHIDYIEKVAIGSGNKLRLPWTLPPVNNTPDFVNRSKYLGTYWGASADTATLRTHQNHREYLHDLIDAGVVILDSTRKVPDASAYVWNETLEDFELVTYSSWEELYNTVKLKDVFPEGSDGRNALDGLEHTFIISGETIKVQYPNIMDELYDYTLRDFLDYAQVYNIETGEVIINGGEEGYKLRKYFALNDQDFFAPDWGPNGANIRATIDFSTSVNRSNYKSSIVVPIPEQYVNTDGNLASIVRAGDHTTKSLSLADATGEIYKMTGTDGDIHPSDGKIHWDDLLSMLTNNKAIDLLNSETFLRNLMAFLNSHIQSGTGINSQYNSTDNTRLLSLSTENGSGISIAEGTGGTSVDSSGKHISANLAAGRGIKITNSDNTTQKTISTTFSNGSGITFTEEDGKILIGNAMMPGNLKLLTPGTDFKVYFSVGAGCCGKFQKTETIVDDNHAVYINYSESIDGSPANIYINGGPRLGITNFGRDDSKLKPTGYESGAGFYFRHTDTTLARQQASRMLKITFTAAGLIKLGIISPLDNYDTSGIDSIADTSSSFTGIWNVGPVPEKTIPYGGPYPAGSCGESWSAVCITEYEGIHSIYVVGLSYADGYNTQIGAHYASHGIPAADLFSNHINLLVSCQLYPKTS